MADEAVGEEEELMDMEEDDFLEDGQDQVHGEVEFEDPRAQRCYRAERTPSKSMSCSSPRVVTSVTSSEVSIQPSAVAKNEAAPSFSTKMFKREEHGLHRQQQPSSPSVGVIPRSRKDLLEETSRRLRNRDLLSLRVSENMSSGGSESSPVLPHHLMTPFTFATTAGQQQQFNDMWMTIMTQMALRRHHHQPQPTPQIPFPYFPSMSPAFMTPQNPVFDHPRR